MILIDLPPLQKMSENAQYHLGGLLIEIARNVRISTCLWWTGYEKLLATWVVQLLTQDQKSVSQRYKLLPQLLYSPLSNHLLYPKLKIRGSLRMKNWQKLRALEESHFQQEYTHWYINWPSALCPGRLYWKLNIVWMMEVVI